MHTQAQLGDDYIDFAFTENRKPKLPFGHRGLLKGAFIPGAKDLLALLHEPGKGALGTRPF
jgi:hypothetical protein